MASYYWSGYWGTSTLRDVGTQNDPNQIVYYSATGVKSSSTWYGWSGDVLYGTASSDLIFLDNTGLIGPRLDGISEFHLGDGNDVLDLTSLRYTYGRVQVLGDAGDDWIFTSDGNDDLYGGSGNDRLKGYGGNDYLEGGTGADALYGGTGRDTASYAHATSGVAADLLAPSYNVGEARGDYYNSIEDLRGSAYSDDLYGDNGANSFAGGAGADVIYGRGGNDYLEGGTGGDALYGGTGIDTASYARATSFVVADLANRTANMGEAKGDSYYSIENLTGSAYADDLYGDAYGNTLSGGAGSDLLYGRGGNDAIYGEAGNDYLYGDAGDDILSGGDGADRITGGAGSDTLTGGYGNDLFVMNSPLVSGVFDRIKDFNPLQDQIALEDAIFTGIRRWSSAGFSSNASGYAQDSTDRIIYQYDTGKLFYDPDGTGSAPRIQFAAIQAYAKLDYLDFVLI